MVIPLRDNAPGYDIPYVNLSLIGGCILVFIWQLMYPGGLESSRAVWGEVPTRILSGEPVPGTTISAWVTLLSSMWMHADWGHLIGNIYGLWLFGDNLEWLLGRGRYVLFYFACGLLASLATVLLGFQSDMAGLGASGAISGVMCAYLLIYPRARITSLMFFFPFGTGHLLTGRMGFQIRNISAFWFIGSWLVFQILYSSAAIGSGVWLNLGIYAHVAGALAGGVLVYLLLNPDRKPKPDHHTQSADLTMVIVGDEGDGGGGWEPAPTLGEELERLRGQQSKSRYRLPEQRFVDYTADDLIQAGKFAEAQQHCREMLAIAQSSQDRHRILGYERMLREIADGARQQQLAEAPASLIREESYEQRVERVKRMLRGNRGKGDLPDWL